MMIRISRRDFAALAAAAFVEQSAVAQTREEPIIARAIPSTGERIAVVGLGTARVFDNDDERTRRDAAEIVRVLVEAGGQVIDTASTYGDAESVLGSVIATAGLRDKAFIATKLERSRTAKRKGVSCPWQPRSKLVCLLPNRWGEAACSGRCGARRFPTGQRTLPAAGRSSSSSTCSPTSG
jgi:Aldo/keto reductase family